MSCREAKAQKIHSDNIKRTNRRRISYAAVSKPTEKAAEIFRRKAYTHETCKKTNADGKEKGHEQC
jgi:hypothetical protein